MQSEINVHKRDSAVTVSTGKQKDHDEPADLRFTMLPVDLGEDENGEPFGSVVLVAADEREPGTLSLGDEEGTNVGRLESLFSTTFHQGNGGTKAEAKGLIVGKGPGQMGSSSFYRAWNELAAARRIAPVDGTQSWRWIPPEDRVSPPEKVLGDASQLSHRQFPRRFPTPGVGIVGIRWDTL